MLERIYQVPEQYVAAPGWARPVFIIVCLMAMVYGYTDAGYAGALIMLLISSGSCAYAWTMIIRGALTEKLIEYGDRFENVYVSSQFPDDANVVWRAERERELLEISGNKLDVQVLIICFREGARVNETWEEFEAFRDAVIANDRATRHEEVLQKYPAFYRQHVQKMKDYRSPIKA